MDPMPPPKPPPITEEKLEQLRQEHPDKELHQLGAPSGEQVVVRTPTRPEWNRYRLKAQNEAKRFEAGEQLVSHCLVHPSRDELEAMLDRRPALAESLLSGLLDVAGLAKGPSDIEKKAL